MLSITDAKEGLKHLRWNERAQLVSYTDCSNKTTAYDYDGYGHLKTITDASGQVTRLTHDAMGALLAVSQPDGSNQSYQYDRAGRLIGATDPLSRSTRFTLNSRGQLTQRTDAANRSVALGYDQAKRLSTLTNENHEQYQFVYDAADRMVEEIRVGGTRVTLDYDVNDQPIAVTMHPGIGDSVQAIEGAATEADKPIRTELIRDAVGRLIEKRSPTHHYHYKYDLMDRLVEAVKLEVVASGAVSGQLEPELKLQLKPLHKTEFKYNKLGDLTEETATDLITGEAHTLTHAHDELGNRTQTQLPALPALPNSPALANTQRALNYLHYGSGHLHQINLSQTTTLASKDARGNAETIHQLIVDIERDELHQETQRSQGAITTRYAHDPLGRRTAAWSQHSGLRNASFKTNDPAWQQALQKPTPGRMDGLMKGYAYDLTGELRQTQHSLNGRTQHKYDATGRIEESLRAARQAGANASANSRAAADPNRSESFGYDPAGNLLDDLANRATNSTASQSQGQNRGYVRDNLVRVFEDKRYAYDGHGRLIQKLSGKHTKQSFQWDDEHRLVAITTTRRPNTPEATTQTVKFDYDALGRRVAKHDSFGTTRFIWEGMRLIEERRGQSVVTYVYEPNSYVPLARIDAMGQATQAGGVGTTNDALPPEVGTNKSAANEDAKNPATANNIYYFHTDQVGLPEELSDSEGTIRWRASYKTWGNAVSESWEAVALNGDSLNATAYAQEAKPLEVQQNLRFQGQYLDRESGLHYNTFRFYDPDIGRFISPDPIGLEGGNSLHTYSRNPISWIDP